MNDTLFVPHNQDYLLRVAPTEYRDEIQSCLKGDVHDENAAALGGIAGHAGVFSTANDLVRFCNMVMDKGYYKGQKIATIETSKLSHCIVRVTLSLLLTMCKSILVLA